ncbi:MAG: hypothetical protein QM528_05770 [Phycisphaerales bacterium]|nr:hypothetical protein [Phycisphaerales bacterium]
MNNKNKDLVEDFFFSKKKQQPLVYYKDLLCSFISQNKITELIGNVLEQELNTPLQAIGLWGAQNNVVYNLPIAFLSDAYCLYDGALYALYAQTIANKKDKYISGTQVNYLVAPLSGYISYNFYDEIKGSQYALRLSAQEQALKTGQCLYVEANKNVLQISLDSRMLQCDEESVLIYFIEKNTETQRIVRLYDPQSLQCVITRNAQLELEVIKEGYIESTFEVIAYGDREHAPDIIFNFLNHKSHIVRWQACKSLFALNFDLGLKALAILEKDPHEIIQYNVKRAQEKLKTF